MCSIKVLTSTELVLLLCASLVKIRRMRRMCSLLLALLLATVPVAGVAADVSLCILSEESVQKNCALQHSSRGMYLAKPPSKTERRVPILMYHYIADDWNKRDVKGKNLYVDPKIFESQLQWLQKNGYQTIDLDEALAYFRGTFVPKGTPVVLTFDDGYDDMYSNALPLLKKYDDIGVFFIVSHFVGKKGYMTATEVRALHNRGMSIEAHTQTHPSLQTLTKKRQEEEILGSVKDLEAIIGAPIRHFAYPSGRYNTTTLSIVDHAKLLTAVTTRKGIATASDHLHALPRVRITNTTKFEDALR